MLREQFLEAILQSAIDYAIISLDLDGLVTSWNEGARRIMGWTELEMQGTPAAVFFTEEDKRSGIPQKEMTAALEKGHGNDERWHLRKDGSRFWASGEMMALREEGGQVQGFIKILRDRTEQRGRDEKNRADAEFMRQVLAASDDCIKALDLDANLIFMSEGGRRVMEVDDFTTVAGCPWPDFWQDSGNHSARMAVEAARAGKSDRFVGKADTAKGNPRWWDVQVSPILDADGKPERILSISRDITERKEAEETQALVMRELGHRVKNTLSVAQAIVKQSLRSSSSVEEAGTKIQARFLALSQAHDILIHRNWLSASMVEIIRGTVQMSGLEDEDRVRISGPEITIGPQQALSISLVVHELLTNAVKYGAMSNEVGLVDITWKITGTESAPALEFVWKEAGGPTVVEPERKGFGSKLISSSLQSLGETTIQYRAEGLHLTLQADLAKLQPVAEGRQIPR
ncbi:PAS domain S-box protein [Rhizobium sp. PL01]|nr:PAS domain-containing protein [Rhizobium sp. PL01]MDW5312969.1 PAS domain S-box protein [Rhizobium sp. PL01]